MEHTCSAAAMRIAIVGRKSFVNHYRHIRGGEIDYLAVGEDEFLEKLRTLVERGDVGIVILDRELADKHRDEMRRMKLLTPPLIVEF